MSQLDLDELTEYALGTLTGPRRRELSRLIAGSAALRAELAAVQETLGRLDESLPASKPRPGARDALLAALDSSARFSPFVADLARHFDLAVTRVRELLQRIDDQACWSAGPLPGIGLIHFAAGPNAVAPDTGFVRLAAGLVFPYHRHLGHEINYVLQGALRDGDGTLVLPGEAIVMPPGSAHEFSVPDAAGAVIAVVQAGFDFVPKPA